MKDIQKQIVKKFGNRLRVRVCGLCIEDGKVLMVNHHSLNENGDFWAPPGGGMEFSDDAESNLIREFQEEAGISVSVHRFLFVHEYLSPPLHAIELFFQVRREAGEVKLGYDPEMHKGEQILKELRYVAFEELKKMDKISIHQLFRNFNSIEELVHGSGYFLFDKRKQ